MNIALISTPFISVPPRNYGGTELIVHTLAEGLVARGHEVTLYATGDSVTSARLEAIYDAASWPPDPLTEIRHLSWAMARIAREREHDIIHANNASAIALAHDFLPERPLVYTLHHPCVEALSRFYLQYPDVWYVSISQRQQQLETALPRVRTIHHGLDPAPYDGPTVADNRVFFIGRLSDFKGTHIAIDAAERAGLEIIIAGRIHDDDDEPGFARREIEPRLGRPHVRYLGPVGMKEKTPLLRSSRALLVPLGWEEPFGLVMIEAMLAGCPVVAFPRGAAPEIVEPGETGFLVQDEDEMVDAIRDGGLLTGFDRERCRARAIERFGRERMVAQYEAYYERALRRSRQWRAAAARTMASDGA